MVKPTDVFHVELVLGGLGQTPTRVMAFSVISISLDSSEESMGTSTARVILFGTIPITIPPTISPAIPIIPPVALIIQYTSPFIDTDSFDSDTPDSPPS
ncbi:hypothetical protein Tco_1430444 [Tanacetum coccineum]